MAAYVAGLNEKPFRAKQLMQWIHQRGVSNINDMSDLAKTFRATLLDKAEVLSLPVIKDEHAQDGTRKWLLDVGAGNAVESVYIPEDDRGTLCISSQAGCAVNCRFCSTGHQGFSRNLSSGEIIGQLWFAEHLLRNDPDAVRRIEKYPTPGWEHTGRVISNVVMMGMGEPLLNYANVLKAVEKISGPECLGMSARRITVSTAGVAKMIRKLGDDGVRFKLALSLHAANDLKRNEIMPINETNNLKELVDALNYFYSLTKNEITFEYILFNNFTNRRCSSLEFICYIDLLSFLISRSASASRM